MKTNYLVLLRRYTFPLLSVCLFRFEPVSFSIVSFLVPVRFACLIVVL